MEIGQHRQKAPDMREWYCVFIQIETDIRGPGDRDRDLLEQRRWIVRQREQPRLFPGEDFADGSIRLIGTAPVSRWPHAIGLGLGIEIVEIGE